MLKQNSFASTYPRAYLEYDIPDPVTKKLCLHLSYKVVSGIRLVFDLGLKTARTLGPNLHQQIPSSQELPGSTLFISVGTWTS